jgi:cell wall-associated NlpC family hydrolase
MSRGTRVAAVVSVAVALVVLGVAFIVIGRGGGDEPSEAAGPAASRGPASAADWVFDRAEGPARTLVHDKGGNLLATFTDGSRTVDVAGTKRTFREPKFTKATVTLDVWVRLAPQEWHAGAEKDAWVKDWLTKELTDTSLDALGIAFQYVDGAPDLYDNNGVRYAGDAQFGPYSSTDADGRAENNDFYDYLGTTYSFPDGASVKPKKDRYGDIDCSGFLRLVYGYRLGYPLRNTNTAGDGLPRRAFAMSQFGPGVEVTRDEGGAARNFAALQPGDLLFFNLDPSDGPQADHSGIFLGVDEAGHYRFISSRTLANGPTMGDTKYAAILDGDGHFAMGFRNARRL